MSGGAGAGALSLRAITRRFAPGGAPAVEALSLDVAAGELLALVGASGSGKTTTLRMVAGYERPDGGSIVLDDKEMTSVPPEKRGFGMVFQHYALFPHLSVLDNVAFGLEARGASKSERQAKARTALDGVGLAAAAARPVQSLSGGEQQRVALARALVIEPRLLLLDEPLSNLDPTLRQTMREELRDMLRRLGVTALFVTHDQEDAFAVADRVALLERGKLLQVGTPETLYHRPASRAVAAFIGKGAIVAATFERDGASDQPQARVTLGGVACTVRAEPNATVAAGAHGEVVLRPEALAFTSAGDANAWPGVVTQRRFAGATFHYQVDVGGTVLEVATLQPVARDGERVGVRVALEPLAFLVA